MSFFYKVQYKVHYKGKNLSFSKFSLFHSTKLLTVLGYYQVINTQSKNLKKKEFGCLGSMGILIVEFAKVCISLHTNKYGSKQVVLWPRCKIKKKEANLKEVEFRDTISKYIFVIINTLSVNTLNISQEIF